ncbi:restriction endonuclease subunit S [Acinetobacter thermotolerans]|uniref:restriction endonuclease subunit S n=1 Tax=Acinetobacter thermotolerans TaxID=3151487 RepID=UPI00325A62E5
MSVPKLRFKEFDGDWSNKKIGNIASKVGSGSTPRGGAEAYTDHGIIFIRSQNVNNDQLLLDDVAYIPEETHVKMSGSKVIANDILLNITGASIGRSCVVPHDFTEANVNQHVCIIRTPNDDPIFVQSFLSSENGQNVIQSKQAGGGREGLNFQAIRSIDFHFPPSKEEQTKIASFLSNVDKKISQLTQKHALLSQYKQGMMQKLFSQQIRFKADDGSEFGAWKHCKLKDVLISYRLGGNYSNAEMVTSYPLIKMGNLGRGSINLDKIEYIPEDQIIDPEDLIKKNDLFFNTRNTLDLVGKVALWRGELPIAYYNSNLLRLDFENNIFMNYLFNEQKTLEKLKAIASGTTSVAAIYTKDLLKINLEIPCLEEQNKIASFLSSIDQKIVVVAQQIEQAKQWKKGLLQQMFV